MTTDINNINNSEYTFIQIKPESMHSNVGIDQEKAITIKEEDCEDPTPTTAITLDANVEHKIFQTRILTSDVKIHDFNDSNNLFNSSIKNNPSEQELIKNCIETPINPTKDKTHSEGNHYDIYTKISVNNKICFRQFKTTTAILKHTNDDDGAIIFKTKSYKCDICMELFATNGNLSSHMEMHERNYKCEICNKCFTTNRIMSRHAKAHTAERNHKCDICAKRFATEQNLTQHVVTHTGERNFKCEICSKRFATKHYMMQHVRAHTDERNFKCETCSKRFTTRQSMSRHLEAHAGETNYKCEICAKSFTTSRSMLRHVKAHASNKNYKCEICNKSFMMREYLSNHVKVHTGTRNFKCEICDKSFARKQSMLEHFKAHSGERNYKCDVCTKYFTTNRIMLRHMKAHTAERNYKCKTCSKRFVTEEYLSRHVLIHTRKSNFKCEVCNNVFTTKQSMLRHTKRNGEKNCKRETRKCIHTLDKNDKCEICNQRKKRETFLEHVKIRPEESYEIQNYNTVDVSSIKEESGKFLKEDNADIFGAIEIKSSTTSKESGFDFAIEEEKPKSTEIFDIWQTLNAEIIIKQEHVMDAL